MTHGPVTPEDLRRIRSWLSPTEFESEGSEYQKHLNSHAPGTGDWLLQTEQFRNWHDSGVGALWIQGIPGSGKSVAAANLIQILRGEDVPVLFFFSRRIIKSNSKPRNLVCDCLCQFLDHSVALQWNLKKAVEHHPLVENIPFAEIWNILLTALSTVRRVYILLDALDELAFEEDDFLRCLLDLGQRRPASIKLIMTSRPLPSLQMVLKGPFLVTLRLIGRRVENDISSYITYRMNNQKERVLTLEDQYEVKLRVCQKSQGLFLYARLMIDEIIQQSSPIQTHLQRLPNSLEEIYVELLHEYSSRSGASLQFQSMLLSSIIHASRPLRIAELAALVNCQVDRGGLLDSQDAKSMVRTSCGPLLEILEDETVQVIHHSFTEFLLETSRSSGEEVDGQEKWFPAFTPARIHRFLTLSCVDYLLSGCFESCSIPQRTAVGLYRRFDQYGSEMRRRIESRLMVDFHLLQYSSQNVLYHAQKCHSLDGELVSKLDKLFQYGSHDFECWKDFLFCKINETTPDLFYPIHIAAQTGFTAYAIHILEKTESLNLLDADKRSPVTYAAIGGHSETVAALLNQKAPFEIHDCYGLAPIHYAAKGGHVNVLQCLLNAGADPMSATSRDEQDYFANDHCEAGKVPMQFACAASNADAVSELLKHLDSQSKSAILPHWACARGQTKALSLLLKHSEIIGNINKRDVKGNTALYTAACIGNSATLRILLEHGADIHLRSYDLHLARAGRASLRAGAKPKGFTPLHGWANIQDLNDRVHNDSVEEWEETGVSLIESGCDIEATDENEQTILFAWGAQLKCGIGHGVKYVDRAEEFVSILLRYGANPRVTDCKGNSVLHNRKMNLIPRVVELLTKAGADINAIRPDDLVTPLIVAAKMQTLDVRVYFDNGADPNMQDSDGNTALHHICRSWRLEFSDIKEWLSFADPRIKNKKGETCVYNLRFGNRGEGRIDAIPLFVEKGLDLESRNRLGRTALLEACHSGQRAFIDGFIRHGANPASKDFRNKSCLHFVASTPVSNIDGGLKDTEVTLTVMKSLIEAGADINAVDFDGNTPFHDAVESSDDFSSLKIRLGCILKLGGAANHSNNHGKTVLHKAAVLHHLRLPTYTASDGTGEIDFLLQESFGIDVHARDNQGAMAIHYAASTSEFNAWKFIQAGAYLNARTNDGRNPLHFAAEAAKSNVVAMICKFYTEKEWSVDQKDEGGCTALHYASRSGDSESVYYLLGSGANASVRDNRGFTPLHAAAEHAADSSRTTTLHEQNTKCFREVMPFGMARLKPFLDVRKDSSFYEIQWASSNVICHEEEARMFRDIAVLLLSAGADPTVRNKSGQTACDIAILVKNEEMVTLLSPLRQSDDAQNSLSDQWYLIRRKRTDDIVRSIHVVATDSYTLLQTAIYLKDEDLLDSLLKAGADPTVLGPEALTPVHYIAHWGLMSMMKVLACHLKDFDVFSPPLLHVAASREQSNIQMVNLLIKLGVNVSALYREFDDFSLRGTGAPVPSYTAAHILADNKNWWNVSALKTLSEAGADLELADADGNTVLQRALNGRERGWVPGLRGLLRDETLDVLIGNGANINALSAENGSTPLTAALKSKQGHRLIQRLLDRGADIEIGEMPALFAAIQSGDLEATMAIIDAGADLNAVHHLNDTQTHHRGPKTQTPLLFASITTDDSMDMVCLGAEGKVQMMVRRASIVTFLLERGSDPLTKLQDGKTTVLHEIARYDGLVAPILKAGIDMEITDSKGRTPLILACGGGSYKTSREGESVPCQFILTGANIHATDNSGSTPLHYAVRSNFSKTASLLLKMGASPSANDKALLSPLYYALSYSHFIGQLRLSDILLSAGADPLFKGPNGETALHLIAKSLIQCSPADGSEAEQYIHETGDRTKYLTRWKERYQYFIDRGCERNGRDNAGNTPLFYYVKEIKPRNEYYRVDPPCEKDVRDMFRDHDLFTVNDEGDTLLHAVAAREENGSESDGLWLFEELMIRGVDPKRENKKGLSSLDVAAACGKQFILDLFAREE